MIGRLSVPQITSNRALTSLLDGGALLYIGVMYGVGIACIASNTWWVNGLGVLLLIHSLVGSAAITHELIHGNLFRGWSQARSLNVWLGKLMTHLNGACYAPWDDLVQHHFNHHIHHADFVPFDLTEWVQSLPPLVRRLCIALEWAYVPVIELMLRWRLVLAPFRQPEWRHLRGRAIALLAYRGALLTVLAWASPVALVLYGFAYLSFVNAMRLADAFHHTYDYVVMGTDIPKRDRHYEQAHTFSTLVSQQSPVLNLLYLNFGYHNAHHHDMRCPWYALPHLHEELYGPAAQNCLVLPRLLGNYHQFRLDRLFSGQGNDNPSENAEALAAFTGGIGVSFLTPP